MQKKAPVLYVGLFATDPISAAKIVKATCREAILDTLKHVCPESYLPEGEHLPEYPEAHPLEKQLSEQEIAAIEKDYINFEAFSCPKDNYHITSVFIGKHKEKLSKDNRQLLDGWKNGVKELIKIDFIVYVPNHLITGYASDTGKVEVSNTHPHMTLLIKEKASAVESNAILEILFQKVPEIFKERRKKVTALAIQYGNINTRFQFEGITGDNCTCGRK